MDDEGLEMLYSDYFKYPLYLDQERVFYSALGNRKMSFTALFTLLGKFSFGSLGKRMKGIPGNLKGEGLVKGGVVVFDSAGKPVYQYQEVTGDPLPMDDILSSVKAIRDGKNEL